jgi:hypothetical protein
MTGSHLQCGSKQKVNSSFATTICIPTAKIYCRAIVIISSENKSVKYHGSFLSNANENYLKSLTFISNSIPRFTNNVFVDLTSLTSLTISGEIILSVQSLENAIYGFICRLCRPANGVRDRFEMAFFTSDIFVILLSLGALTIHTTKC